MSEAWQLARSTVLPPAALSRRQFFFNSTLPEGARNVYHAYAPIEKLGVIMEQAGPEDRADVSLGLGTIIRLETQGFRMYYTVYPRDGTHSARIAVAESVDGLQWHKLRLRKNGANENYIIFGGLSGDLGFQSQPQVLHLPDSSWRMYFWKMRDGHARYTVAVSSDGLDWRVPDIDAPVLYHPADMSVKAVWTRGLAEVGQPNNQLSRIALASAGRLLTNDAAYVYYNNHLDRYECYSVWLTPSIPDRRVDADNAPGVLRTIQRRLSSDGLMWSGPELIVKPDEHDPWDQQLYYLGVQWHEDWLIGSLGNYRVEDGQQTMDLELAFSRDGRQWERPLRAGFIPRDPIGRDSMGISVPNGWLDCGDRWVCLYSGTSRRHNEARKLDRPPACIMAATFGKNRFVGLAVGESGGGFLSAPFFPQSENLTIDATIRGVLRAELCDMWGRKLPGFHLMDAQPITGDSTAHVLRWQSGAMADFNSTCVRLRFEYTDGVIYNIRF